MDRRGFPFRITSAPGDATRIADQWVAGGGQSVIVVGGDGTLMETLDGLPYDSPFAVFPTGTVNLFARGLSIPGQAEPWLDMLDNSLLHPVYGGLANGRPFHSCGSCGLTSWTVEQVNPTLKKHFQEFAYGVKAFELYFRYRAPNLTVRLDGEVFEPPLQGMVFSLGPCYGGPNHIFPGNSVSHPEMEVALLVGQHRRILWKYVFGMLVGSLPKMSGVVYRKVQRIDIETDPQHPVELDGDHSGFTPAEIKIDKQARSVLAPG